MKKHKIFSVVLFLSLFYLLIPFPLSAGAPTDLIRTTVGEVLAVLKDPRLKSDTRERERRDQLRQVIYPIFDFTKMAKRSLGPHWHRRTFEEQQEFVEIFTGLLESSYLNQIESNNDGKFIISREAQDKNYAEVDTKIVTKKGEEFSITYRLHLVNENWKIYGIVVKNISLVNNYRSQFNRVITHSSYEELLRRLKDKLLEVGRKKKNNGEKLGAVRGWLDRDKPLLKEAQRMIMFLRFAQMVRKANFSP